MAIVVEQGLTDRSGFSTSIDFEFVADFGGSNPTAGNALIVAVTCQSNVSIDSISDNQGNTWETDQSTPSTTWRIFRASDISSGVTTLTIGFGGSTTPTVFCLEVSGMTNTSPLQDNNAYASDGDGTSTTHTVEYTTLSAGELVLIYQQHASETITGTGSAIALQDSGQLSRSVVYEIVPTATTADIGWSSATARNVSSGLVSYSPAATSSVPPSVFLNANQIIG